MINENVLCMNHQLSQHLQSHRRAMGNVPFWFNLNRIKTKVGFYFYQFFLINLLGIKGLGYII